MILKRNNYFDEENRQIKKIDKNIIKSDLENLTKKYKNEELKHVSELEIKLIKRNSIVNRDEILKDSNLNNFHHTNKELNVEYLKNVNIDLEKKQINDRPKSTNSVGNHLKIIDSSVK